MYRVDGLDRIVTSLSSYNSVARKFRFVVKLHTSLTDIPLLICLDLSNTFHINMFVKTIRLHY